MKNYPQLAALVLAKCAAYDPYLTEPTEETARAWAEQFELYNLDLKDLLDAVTRIYRDNGSGYRPLPKDITDAARAIRKDRSDREDDEARGLREARNDAKALDEICRRTGQSFGHSIEGAY